LAFGLILQAVSQTLVDSDVDALMSTVIERLERELGATLRS
jgi:phenylalanyl-tRNA synthetase beta subunit